jgi:hypothetical protein
MFFKREGVRNMSVFVHHAALSFERDPEGDLSADRAEAALTPQAAILKARQFAKSAKGAVAFTRRVDLDRGRYGDPVVLTAIGELPDDVMAFVPTS